MWNVLFADGKAAGLTISGSQSADITNATFVNNIGRGVQGTGSIYNSLTWNNGDNTIKDNDTKNEANNDIAFPANTENGDVLNGPNFVDPNNGDYRIRPSLMLLDKGSNDRYQLNADINSEKDLGNTARLIGDNIDIGAYECDTKMIQVIYVKKVLLLQEQVKAGISQPTTCKVPSTWLSFMPTRMKVNMATSS